METGFKIIGVSLIVFAFYSFTESAYAAEESTAPRAIAILGGVSVICVFIGLIVCVLGL